MGRRYLACAYNQKQFCGHSLSSPNTCIAVTLNKKNRRHFFSPRLYVGVFHSARCPCDAIYTFIYVRVAARFGATIVNNVVLLGRLRYLRQTKEDNSFFTPIVFKKDFPSTSAAQPTRLCPYLRSHYALFRFNGLRQSPTPFFVRLFLFLLSRVSVRSADTVRVCHKRSRARLN